LAVEWRMLISNFDLPEKNCHRVNEFDAIYSVFTN